MLDFHTNNVMFEYLKSLNSFYKKNQATLPFRSLAWLFVLFINDPIVPEIPSASEAISLVQKVEIYPSLNNKS